MPQLAPGCARRPRENRLPRRRFVGIRVVGASHGHAHYLKIVQFELRGRRVICEVDGRRLPHPRLPSVPTHAPVPVASSTFGSLGFRSVMELIARVTTMMNWSSENL